MRFSVTHEGVPVGFVELRPGELVAGSLAPLPALEPLRDTIRAGSNALVALGFFGAPPRARESGSGQALRAAAALEFDLLNNRGELTPATFVNVLEVPDGDVVVIARFAHEHATVAAAVRPSLRRDSGGNNPRPDEGDA